MCVCVCVFECMFVCMHVCVVEKLSRLVINNSYLIWEIQFEQLFLKKENYYLQKQRPFSKLI